MTKSKGPVDNAVKVLIAGDFCPINRIEDLALNQDYENIFNDFIQVFQGNDLNIVDLECPLTHTKTARPKTGPHQKAHPDTIRVLKHGNINLVAMANNHVMDYGKKGIEDTLYLLEENGIQTVGIGKSVSQAAKPISVKIRNISIAILNMADNEFLSTPDGSYTCNSIDALQCFYDIKNAKETHDYVFVIVHSGNEFYELPSPRIKILYRYIADLGADVVIAHHTHVFSGYEIYNSKPIFYGLGNFLYDWPGKVDSTWNRGYMVRLEISSTLDFEIIPFNQNNKEPGIFHLSAEETEDFYKDIERLNKIIQDDQVLEAKFSEYCRSVFPMYDAFIEPNLGRYINALRKKKLFPGLLSRKKRLLLLNLTRCESHRDVLLRLLKQNE
jgi:poly-gamma-glutamate capsule biosynthesis protein CapA/YwtB (metallophosphatase superfamily)